jgi:hypothetical protein
MELLMPLPVQRCIRTKTRNLWPGRSRRKASGAHLAVEHLENRLVPASMFTAIPGVHVLQSGGATPAGGPTSPAGLSHSQIAHGYGFDQITFNNGTVIGNGNGQTIAIIDAYNDPNIASDLATFDSTFGLAAPPSFTKVGQSGGALPTATNQGWGSETSLDVEWAHAMAPGANILLVEANSENLADLFAAEQYARSQPAVSVISMSWLYYEWSTEASYDSTYFTTPYGHNGITFVASSGDSGASYVYYPSTSPNVLAVGGTQLTLDASGNYVSETGWSGSGGGFSAYESQPAYQRGVVTQGSIYRATPDVAYDGSASSPFAVYDTEGYGGWVAAYGTSAGAPQWAALIAIADQGRALAGKGSLDGATQTLPTLYQLPSSDFHDITTGSNGKYSAGPGYDLVTGRGTPRANLIVSGLVGSTSVPTTTNQPPTVVTPASTNTSTVTGKTANLSVLGADADGDALTYTWSLTSQPSGATTPTFSVNGTSAANNTTATFYQAGSYTFQVTITDTSGLSVTSSVSVTVNQILTSLSVTPGTATIADSASQQFSAVELDQFGKAMATQPTFTWALATGGIGSLSSSGMYTAPSSGTGSATVDATASSMTGGAAVTVASIPATPTNLTATVISSHRINLAWQESSTNVSGFTIERTANNGSSWSTIATVDGTTLTYADTTVKKGKTYKYRVQAYNSAGTSAWSSVTPGATPAVQILAAAALPDSLPVESQGNFPRVHTTLREAAQPNDLLLLGLKGADSSVEWLSQTNAPSSQAESSWFFATGTPSTASKPTVAAAVSSASSSLLHDPSGDQFSWMPWHGDFPDLVAI